MGEGTRTRPLHRTTLCAIALASAALGAAPARAVPVGEPPAICDRSLPGQVDYGHLLGEDGTFAVRSVGDAVIVGTLYLPSEATRDRPVPVVMRTHGGGGSRGSLGPNQGSLTKALIERGYAVMTWDTRGHGESKKDAAGRPNVLWSFDAPGLEVQDARALIRVLARCRAIAQEGPGDPVLGWVGTSNGAGIQLNTAAQEPAVDAIVPRLTWGDLRQDLAPNGVPKAYDALLVENLVKTRVQFDPMVGAIESEAATGALSGALVDWLGERSTLASAPAIRAPTLLLQGSMDTLFPLQDAFALFDAIRATGTPVKLIPHCVPHDVGEAPRRVCRSTPRLDEITLLWLDRYLKGQPVDTGPAVEWQAQDGQVRPAAAVPTNTVRVDLRRRPRRPLARLTGPGGSGGDTATFAAPAGPDQPKASWTRLVLRGPDRSCRPLFGRPRLWVNGAVGGGDGYLFAELQDVEPGGLARTINSTATPLRLSRGRFAVKLDLNGVAWTISRQHRLVLELTTGSDMYLEPRRFFKVRIDRVRAALPSTLSGAC